MLRTRLNWLFHKQKAEQHMIPLRRLDEFVQSATGSEFPSIQLIKMDTEGSEIDIVRSGLSIFEQNRYVLQPLLVTAPEVNRLRISKWPYVVLVTYRVQSFVVELGVRHWIENKNISLEEGFTLMEQIRSKFDGFVCFSDPQLPIAKGIVAKIDPQKVQNELQADPENISLKALAQVTTEVRLETSAQFAYNSVNNLSMT